MRALPPAERREVLAATAGLALFFAALYGPLLLANVPFQDDNIRALFGTLFWDNVGRWAAIWLMRGLTFSNGLDVYPLTYAWAVAFMAAGTVVATLAMRGRIDRLLLATVAVAFLNPFLLQAMSFRYDCMSMAFAAAAAVAGGVLIVRAGAAARLAQAGLLLALLLAYQPAVGLFAGFAAFAIADAVLGGGPARATLAAATRRAVPLAALAGAYIVAFPHVATAFPERGAFDVHAIGRNLRYLADAARLLFGPVRFVLAGLCALLLAAHAVRTRAWGRALLLLLLLLVAIPVALGPNLVLHEAPTGVRVLVGFPAAGCIALLLLARASRRAAIAAVTVAALADFSLCCRYANFVHAEDIYRTVVASGVAYDLAHAPALRPVRRVVLLDTFPLAPEARVAVAEAPILGLISQEYRYRWIASLRLARMMDGVALDNECVDTAGPGWTKAVTTRAYRIMVRGETAAVIFGTGAIMLDGCRVGRGGAA